MSWRKDPSGAEELHRRSLNNHEYLTASGPISHLLCRCFPPSSSSYLHSYTHTLPPQPYPAPQTSSRFFGALIGEAGLNCRCFQGREYSLLTPGSAPGAGCGGGGMVRHLTGVCNPLAPSGAAESAPSISRNQWGTDHGLLTPSSGCFRR